MLVKEKYFYRNLISIAAPIALQNLIGFGIQTTDVVMVGWADPTGTLLSAANLANQPVFLLNMFAFGLGSACTVLSAQYWGKKNVDAVKRVMSIAIRVAVAVALLFFIAALLIPEFIMSLYTSDPATIAAGALYMRTLAPGLLVYGINTTLIVLLRSAELVIISVITHIVTLFLNILLNWALIFGNLGMPALGIQGAAIATMTVRVIEFIIILIYLFKVDKRLNFKLRELLIFDRILFKDLLKHGSPVLINEFLWGLGVSVQSAIFGHITYGTGNTVAAYSVVNTIQQLGTILMFGIASATGVIVGRTIGEGKIKTAKDQSDTFRVLALAVGLLSCGLLLLIRSPMVAAFGLEPLTSALAEQMMIVTAFNVLFVSFSSIFIVGVLRGAGDTRFCLVLEMGSLWCVSLPVAFVMSVFLRLPVPVVLIGMRVDEVIKAVVCLFHTRNEKWIRVVARDSLPGTNPDRKRKRRA